MSSADCIKVVLFLFSVFQSDAYYFSTTERPCADLYKDSYNICEDKGIRGTMWLTARPIVISSPADAATNCREYQAGVSCSMRLEVGEGQKIYVRTGSIYNLADMGCDDCNDCDSFTINRECIKASLPSDEPVAVLDERHIIVNFTSYNIKHPSYTRAQIKLSAIGCPHRELVQWHDQYIRLENVNNTAYTADTTSYTVNISCGSGVLPDQHTWMLVECRRFQRNATYDYRWTYTSKLSCGMSTSTTAVIITIVLLVIGIAVVLIVLACLRCFPCQRGRRKERKQLATAGSDEELQAMTVTNGNAHGSAEMKQQD